MLIYINFVKRNNVATWLHISWNCSLRVENSNICILRGMVFLSSQDLFHRVAWYGVEEQEQKYKQSNRDYSLQNSPFVIVPDYVLDRLQRIEEPHEWCVRSTAQREKYWKYREKNIYIIHKVPYDCIPTLACPVDLARFYQNQRDFSQPPLSWANVSQPQPYPV